MRGSDQDDRTVESLRWMRWLMIWKKPDSQAARLLWSKMVNRRVELLLDGMGAEALNHSNECVDIVTQEALQCLEDYPNILRWPSMIFRLADDLGTSSVNITIIN
ncbi:hypothetical protein FEM48_Zijuj10G0119300 [Ziziphus jujuba var. spinosa]|uniref:Uncharacterized protein n=1 Tax=Ziziphus jujuba var. spinosa TaxID=714518 RepID=A0A978UN85_ZIZJJ|nr:hypothetical protein FEM48_Zijuj10G0119300 [Ziziphus jujuba var. spinosa]